jgi:quercetin dioxygenase-like cupin family protein
VSPVLPGSIANAPVFRIKPEDTNKFVLLVEPHVEHPNCVQVVEIFDEGGRTPVNSHAYALETFFVLRGSGVAHCNGQTQELRTGSFFAVRPGQEHWIQNTGPGRLYCFTTMVPNEGFVELIRAGVRDVLDEDDLRVLGLHQPRRSP